MIPYLLAMMMALAVALWTLFHIFKIHHDVNQALNEHEGVLDGITNERANPDVAGTELGRRVRLLMNEALAQGREKRSIGAIAAGSMTHDFRTPIARMLSRVESALHDDNVDKTRTLEYTLDQLHHLCLVFDRLLTFVKLDAPNAKLPHIKTDLSTLVATLVEDYELIFESESLELNSVVEPMIFVDGNQELLQLVLINLLENIHKYALNGKRADLSLRRYSRHCTITIRDYGPGLPETTKTQALLRFWQEKKETTAGFGLGLALVQEIISLHKGKLDLANAKPGLLITIQMPINDS